MRSDEMAPAVRELIHRHLRSMDHAEATLHLAESPDGAHQPNTVAGHHRWTEAVAAQVLDDLAESGLVVRDERGYRLAPGACDAAVMTALFELYHRQPVTLVRAIYAAPMPIKPFIRPALADDEAS